MRFFVGIAVLAVAGSCSASILGGLIGGLLGRPGYTGYGIDWGGWPVSPNPVHEGGSIWSIPGDILTAIKIVFRSLWKIITFRPIEGIKDLILNAITLVKNIFNDILGRPHGINPKLQDCNGMLTINEVTGLAECRPYENLGGTNINPKVVLPGSRPVYTSSYQNAHGAGYQVASGGYVQPQVQVQSQRSRGKNGIKHHPKKHDSNATAKSGPVHK